MPAACLLLPRDSVTFEGLALRLVGLKGTVEASLEPRAPRGRAERAPDKNRACRAVAQPGGLRQKGAGSMCLHCPLLHLSDHLLGRPGGEPQRKPAVPADQSAGTEHSREGWRADVQGQREHVQWAARPQGGE